EDATAVGGVLHRVPEEIPDDLLQAQVIAVDEDLTGIEDDLQLDELRLCREPNGVDGGLNHRCQCDRFDRQAQGAIDDAGDVQQVIDEPSLLERAPADILNRTVRWLDVEVTGGQDG